MGMRRGEKGWGVNIDKLIVLIEVRTKLSLDHEEAKSPGRHR